MGTNHTDVIHRHLTEANELLEHADALDDQLEALTRGEFRSKNGQYADLHNELGTTLKLAHIKATLAVAEALEGLRTAPRTPAPRAGDYL